MMEIYRRGYATANETDAHRDFTIFIGTTASASGDNAIVLSASNNGLTATSAGFYVNPIPDLANAGETLLYNPVSGAIWYDSDRRRLEEKADVETRTQEVERQLELARTRIAEVEAKVQALTETVQKLLA